MGGRQLVFKRFMNESRMGSQEKKRFLVKNSMI